MIARREFITLLGGGAAAVGMSPRATRAQGKRPTVGFLGPGTPSTWAGFTAPFIKRMSELGWTDGRNLTIDYLWTDGHNERLSEFAAELARRRVDVLFAPTTIVAIAAKKQTSTIPIVFTLVGDPVAIGLVASLARPGSNVTGLSNQSVDLPGKRLDLMREVLPGLRRLAILVNGGNPSNLIESKTLETSARAIGLEAVRHEIRQAADVAPALDRIVGGTDMLYVIPDPLTLTNFPQINTTALGARLPTMYGSRDFVQPGGLMSYGANFPDLFRRAGDYVDKILHGAKPADLPVEQPTKFELVVNLTTAKALGLKIPEAFLLRADEVIE
jgi:putative ABC transport system substrate-binding protein